MSGELRERGRGSGGRAAGARGGRGPRDRPPPPPEVPGGGPQVGKPGSETESGDPPRGPDASPRAVPSAVRLRSWKAGGPGGVGGRRGEHCVVRGCRSGVWDPLGVGDVMGRVCGVSGTRSGEVGCLARAAGGPVGAPGSGMEGRGQEWEGRAGGGRRCGRRGPGPEGVLGWRRVRRGGGVWLGVGAALTRRPAVGAARVARARRAQQLQQPLLVALAVAHGPRGARTGGEGCGPAPGPRPHSPGLLPAPRRRPSPRAPGPGGRGRASAGLGAAGRRPGRPATCLLRGRGQPTRPLRAWLPSAGGKERRVPASRGCWGNQTGPNS